MGGIVNGSCSLGRFVVVVSLLLPFACMLSTVAHAQGLPEFPGIGTPSKDCGCPRGDETIPVSNGMLEPFLPNIPNLELGYLYYFGNNVRTGRLTADYVVPIRLNNDSVLFGEAHAEVLNFWKRPDVSTTTPANFTTTISGASNRVDLSFGGGYRTMLGANSLLGVNGFYDASRVFQRWHSSGGVGLEFAANSAGDDAIDVNINWYGNLFNRDVLVNAFRNKGNSFDVEAGYSHALFGHSVDVRLKLAGYQFDIGDKVYGWRVGADLTTRDGVFTLRYEYGSDRLDGQYNTVGGFVNVGFQLENLLSGQSPFTLPEPVFRSPRDLRRLLGLKVRRNWHQPEGVVLAATTPLCPNLKGSIARLAVLPPGFSTFTTSPPIPDTDPVRNTVRICWCRLKTFPIEPNQIRFCDGTGGIVSFVVNAGGSLEFATSDGCMVRGMGMSGGSNTWNHVEWFGPLQTVEFDTGGGFSFEFL